MVKVNGDYLDTRIKNTADELEEYDSETNNLLDKIFDEYGLAVCGYSRTLRIRHSRTPLEGLGAAGTERIGFRGENPSEKARRLTESQDSVVVRPEGADQFFGALEEKVLALQSLQTRDPLAPDIAVATVKRYLQRFTCAPFPDT